jgi:hypothetical protein
LRRNLNEVSNRTIQSILNAPSEVLAEEREADREESPLSTLRSEDKRVGDIPQGQEDMLGWLGTPLGPRPDSQSHREPSRPNKLEINKANPIHKVMIVIVKASNPW